MSLFFCVEMIGCVPLAHFFFANGFICLEMITGSGIVAARPFLELTWRRGNKSDWINCAVVFFRSADGENGKQIIIIMDISMAHDP